MKFVLLIVGIIIGVLGTTVPRMYGIDFLKSLENHSSPQPAAPVEPTEQDKKDKPSANNSPSPGELELRKMIAEVSKQRAALEEREKPLAMREARLEEQRKTLEALKQSIDQCENNVKKQVVEVDVGEVKNLKKLGKMWSQMEPIDAMHLAAAVDKDMAVKVLATMTERQSGAILGSMSSTPELTKLAGEYITRLKQLKQPAPAGNGESQ